MTEISSPMENSEYWSRTSYDPSTYLDDFSVKFVDDLLATDVNCLTSCEKIIKEEFEENASSSSSPPSETDQRVLQSSSIDALPNLICGVCGAPAHGYNFDQITCESCKAFFRRNALKSTTYLKCRFSGSCAINVYTRRQCTYCRLKKCFDIKMRKDWIRTEEERELRRLKNLSKQQKKSNKHTLEQQTVVDFPIVMRKKKRILPSATKPVTQESSLVPITPTLSMQIFGIHRNIPNDVQCFVNNIQHAYKIGADQADCSHISRYTSSASLSQFLDDEAVMYKSLILFYKSIPEFKEFNLDDQILLVKCNTVDIIHLHHIIVQSFQEIPQISTHMSKWISQDFHQQMSRTRQKFDRFMRYPVILQIALIVFIFTINLSTPQGSSRFVDYQNKRKVYLCQNLYLSILWRYLNYVFDEKEAIRSMQVLVMQILRYQTLMMTMGEILSQSGHQDIFNPLTQSILGLT